MAIVYAIASQKGGTGKTSSSISIAAGLARRGQHVLLIDTDSQANASKVLIPDYLEAVKEDGSIYRTIIGRQALPIRPTPLQGLDIVPSHILLSETDVRLTTAFDHRESRLRTFLDPLKSQYDTVIIDCPPALSWLTINAFTAADQIIVVISPGYFELDSTVQICHTVREVQEFFNPVLKLRGFLFNMSDPTVNSKTSLKLLRQTYPGNVFNTIIPRNVDLKNATFNKTDIFAHAPHSKAAEAYGRLIEEVFL